MLKLKHIALALSLFGLMTAAAPAEAAWPERPVTVISQGAPGSMMDLATRQVAAMLTEELGQPFLVVNHSGNGGNMAVNALLQAKKDGYTLCATGPHPFAYNLLTMKTRYKFEDLQPISLTANSNMAIIAHPDSGWKNVHDAFAAAKAANRPLKVGVMDNLSRDIFALIAQKEGVKLAPVPQKGGMPCLSAVMGKHVDLGLVGSIAVDNTKAGKVVTLASASTTRFPALPDVPTLQEQGYDAAASTDASFVWFTAAGVPDEVVDTVSNALIKLSTTPAYKKMQETLIIDPAVMGRAHAEAAMKAEHEGKKKLLGK